MVSRPRSVLPSLLGGGAGLALIMLLGRGTGLARDVVLASQFGLTASGDTAAVLLALPDLMLALLVTNGMNAAIVPRLAKAPRKKAIELARLSFTGVGLVFCLAGLLFALSPELLFQLLAPGSRSIGVASAATINLTAVAIPLAALSGVTVAWLNAHARFVPAGIGTILFNAGVVGAMLMLAQGGDPLFGLALGIVGGAGLRLIYQAALLPAKALLPCARMTRESGRIVHDFGMGIAATSVGLLPPIILRAVASFLGPGMLVTMNLSQKLVELPVGVLIGTFSTLALTSISNSVRDRDLEHAIDLARDFTRHAIFLGAAATATAVLFARPIVQCVFGYGAIQTDDVDAIAGLFAIGVFSLPITAVAMVGTSYLYATGRPRSALQPAIAACLVTPLAAIPAVVFNDDRLLMVAFLAAQITLALGIASKTHLHRRAFEKPAQALVNSTRTSVFVLAPIGCAWLLESLLPPHPPLVSLSIATAGAAISGLVYLRLAKVHHEACS